MTGRRPGFRACAALTLAILVGGTAIAATRDAARLPRPRPIQAGEATATETGATEPAASNAAQSSDDLDVRLPRPRPAIEPPAETVAWADGAEAHFADARNPVTPPPASLPSATLPQGATTDTAVDAIEIAAPLPRPRPVTQPASTELAMVAPRSADIAPEPQPTDMSDAACQSRLRALGVVFTEEPPLDPGGACNVDHPLNVTALGDAVALEPEAILNCATAESLAKWIQQVVVPAAQNHFGVTPTTITHDSTYVCRPRNNVRGAKLSEHAHANAVDVASFSFAEHADAEIGREKGVDASSFEAEIRSGACRYFTTVLGPGSNAAHATHFHLDMAVRRHGYRLCELGAPSIARARR